MLRKIYSSESDEYLNDFRGDAVLTAARKNQTSRKLVIRKNASPPNGIIIQYDPEIVIERANILSRERAALLLYGSWHPWQRKSKKLAASFCRIVRRITSAKYSAKLEVEATIEWFRSRMLQRRFINRVERLAAINFRRRENSAILEAQTDDPRGHTYVIPSEVH